MALTTSEQVEVPHGVRSILNPAGNLLPHQWVEKYRRRHEKDAAERGRSGPGMAHGAYAPCGG